MAFASPSASSRKILSVSDTATTGTVNYLFTVPQDSDTVVCKFWTGAQFPAGLAGSATVRVQTTEDGGSTWRDAAVWATTSVIASDNAHFQPFATIGSYTRGAAQWVGSVQASTLVVSSIQGSALGVTSGMPLLGTLNRISIVYAGTVTTGGINVDVFAPTTQLR